MKNFLIYLIGYSGTGKYTIAQEIASRVPAVIVDNQLINTPVFTVVKANGISALPTGVWWEICKIREAVFNAMRYLAKPRTNFIVTNELFDSLRGDNKIFEEVEEIAKIRNSLFVPVRLTCAPNELLKRITSSDRRARLKDLNTKRLKEKLKTMVLLMPHHPNLLQLDVTSLSPKLAADKIMRHSKSLQSNKKRMALTC